MVLIQVQYEIVYFLENKKVIILGGISSIGKNVISSHQIKIYLEDLKFLRDFGVGFILIKVKKTINLILCVKNLC